MRRRLGYQTSDVSKSAEVEAFASGGASALVIKTSIEHRNWGEP